MIPIDTESVSKTRWSLNTSAVFSGATPPKFSLHIPGSTPISGSLFIVEHFLKAEESERFWTQAFDAEKAFALDKCAQDKGFSGHAFWPTVNAAHGHDFCQMFCLWEARDGTTAADMQTFIDSPESPSFPFCVNNVFQIDTKIAVLSDDFKPFFD